MKPSCYILYRLSILLILASSVSISNAQLDVGVSAKGTADHDTSYFSSFSDKLIVRTYLSRKFTQMQLVSDGQGFDFTYEPNTTLNLGIGFTYEWATLNLAYGFGFLNPEEGKGETKYLDMQFHSYGRKVMLDAFAQFYRGFYVDRSDINPGDDSYYVRPDLDVYEIGGVVQYVFNNNKFSYRSSFMQNEWQKRSAGSLLLGAEVFVGNARSDSTMIPFFIDSAASSREFNDLGFFELGPSIGYAHTFVIGGHWFLHGSFSLGLTYGNTSYKSAIDGKQTEKGLSPNSTIKFAAGYNSEKWIVNILATNTAVDVATPDADQQVGIATGNVRLIVAKRLDLGDKIKKKINGIRKKKGQDVE
jgi:hypothetical protein